MTGRDMGGTQNMIDGTKDGDGGTRDTSRARIRKTGHMSRDIKSPGRDIYGDGTCALGPPARAPIPSQTTQEERRKQLAADPRFAAWVAGSKA